MFILLALQLLIPLAHVEAYLRIVNRFPRSKDHSERKDQRRLKNVIQAQKEGKSMLELAKERAAAKAAAAAGGASESSVSSSSNGGSSSSNAYTFEGEGKLEFKDDFPRRFKLKETDPNTLRAGTTQSTLIEEKSQRQSTTEKQPTGAIFGSLSIDDLNARMQQSSVTQPKPLNLERKEEDLNGIEPYKPFQFSLVAAFMAFIGWKFTIYMTENFGVSLLDSEFYPVQRFAIVARNVIIGLSTIFASFSGCIALGLVGLGIVVSIGVAKGELDPTLERKDTQLSEEKIGQIQTITDMFTSLRGTDDDASKSK